MQASLTRDCKPCNLPHRYNPFGKLQETTANDIDRRIIIRNGTIQCQDDANGSLIAVSYEARASGVKRNDRGLEARLKCPTLTIVQVPVKRGKADLSLYRSASDRVFQVLIDSIVHSNSNNSAPSLVQVEIASIDEVYLDVTDLCQFILNEKHHDWDDLISAASRVTTVGGIETMTHAMLLMLSRRMKCGRDRHGKPATPRPVLIQAVWNGGIDVERDGPMRNKCWPSGPPWRQRLVRLFLMPLEESILSPEEYRPTRLLPS